jgi:hypothetical protein
MMKRRSLLACGLGAVALAPRWAGATSPDPIYMNIQTIVLHLRIATKEKEFHRQIGREEMQARLVEFIYSELAQASIKVAVFDANTYRQPDDYPSEWILKLDCRVDLSTRNVEGEPPQTIGIVSVVLRRGETSHLSAEPFEIFILDKKDGDLIATAEAAAKAALKRSVLDTIIHFNR